MIYIYSLLIFALLASLFGGIWKIAERREDEKARLLRRASEPYDARIIAEAMRVFCLRIAHLRPRGKLWTFKPWKQEKSSVLDDARLKRRVKVCFNDIDSAVDAAERLAAEFKKLNQGRRVEAFVEQSLPPLDRWTDSVCRQTDLETGASLLFIRKFNKSEYNVKIYISFEAVCKS